MTAVAALKILSPSWTGKKSSSLSKATSLSVKSPSGPTAIATDSLNFKDDNFIFSIDRLNPCF